MFSIYWSCCEMAIHLFFFKTWFVEGKETLNYGTSVFTMTSNEGSFLCFFQLKVSCGKSELKQIRFNTQYWKHWKERQLFDSVLYCSWQYGHAHARTHKKMHQQTKKKSTDSTTIHFCLWADTQGTEFLGCPHSTSHHRKTRKWDILHRRHS